jgi:hypothetical protein
MIFKIENNIREKLDERFRLVDKKLIFFKYSTHISGFGLGNKIIFFVFSGYSSSPFCVVKTIRTYRDADVIRKGYKCLKLLNSLTSDSVFSRMFPEALLFFDDGFEIWSVESVCIGRQANSEDIEYILKEYISLSKHLAKGTKSELIINTDYGNRIIDNLSGSKEAISELRNYLAGIWGEVEIKMPSIAQHGDLTIDNILIQDGNIKIIDCDTFNTINIPGFDVFHLLTRSKIPEQKNGLIAYFQSLNVNLIPDRKIFFIYFLHELQIKKDYILIGSDINLIVRKFENMVSSY